MTTLRTVRLVSLLLTALTGFSGLVYEVAWQKSLATLLGSHSEATAAVLGIYLGGLAVGYAVFARVVARVVGAAERSSRPPRLLLLYGLVEASIGLWALAFPAFFRGAQAVSVMLPHTSPGVAFAIDVFLTILLIGPPTVMMGGTIPVLTQALAESLDDATRVHAHIYASNTAGAFVGALASGFVMIPLYGIQATLFAMGIVNLAAGATFAFMGSGRRAASTAVPTPAQHTAVRGFAVYAVIALLLGFAMMTTQTVLVRMAGLAFGASHFTFSMVVAVFVLCIALGSFFVSSLKTIRPAYLYGSLWVLALLLTFLYMNLADLGYYVHVLRSLFRDEDAGFYPYYITAFVLMLGVLAIPIGISGASLPLLFHLLRHEVGDLGLTAGRLYSWNTVGSLLGALLGGYALFFWLDLHAVFRVGLGAVIVAATLATMRLVRVRWIPVTLGAAAIAAMVMLPAWPHDRLAAGLFRHRQPRAVTLAGPDGFFEVFSRRVTVEMYVDDPIVSVTVRQMNRPGSNFLRSIITNGKSDGGLATDVPADYPTMALVGIIPCLIADECRSAFVIGLGTGVTAGELTQFESMERILVSEISPGVIEAAPLFDFGNHAVSRSPKVEILRSDAYRALLRSEERFDLIASEPSNPWVSGVEMLFSREFLSAARERLKPGGVYAQWMHTYETNDETVELVLRTYASVFDRVAVWSTMGNDLLLLGMRDSDAKIDLDRIVERAERPEYKAGLQRSGVESIPELLAHELLPLGVANALGLEGEVHTLLHPRLSHLAARAFFGGKNGLIPPSASAEPARVGAENSVLGQYVARHEGALPEEAYAAMLDEVCARPQPCTAIAAHWKHAYPDSALMPRTLHHLRQKYTISSNVLDPSHLARTARLFGGSESARGVSLDEATRISRSFAAYYHHGFPFSREVLSSAWRHCKAEGGGCAEGRMNAEEYLGPLQPTPSTSDSAAPGH